MEVANTSIQVNTTNKKATDDVAESVKGQVTIKINTS